MRISTSYPPLALAWGSESRNLGTASKVRTAKNFNHQVTKTRSHKLRSLKYFSNSCFDVFVSWWLSSSIRSSNTVSEAAENEKLKLAREPSNQQRRVRWLK